MGLFDFLKEKPAPVPKVSEVKAQAQPITINPRIPNINLRQAARLARLFDSRDTPEILDAREVCVAKLRGNGIKKTPRNLAEAQKFVLKLQEG